MGRLLYRVMSRSCGPSFCPACIYKRSTAPLRDGPSAAFPHFLGTNGLEGHILSIQVANLPLHVVRYACATLIKSNERNVLAVAGQACIIGICVYVVAATDERIQRKHLVTLSKLMAKRRIKGFCSHHKVYSKLGLV